MTSFKESYGKTKFYKIEIIVGMSKRQQRVINDEEADDHSKISVRI